MTVLGVDPGQTGALVALENGKILDIIDMPVVDGLVNSTLLTAAIKHLLYHIHIAVVEQVHSMPRQGVASSFKFGRGLGNVEGVLGALGIPIKWVTPTKWTTSLGVGSDKDLHRRRAIETWPDHAERFARKKDDGRADAALIAWWSWNGG